MDLALIRTFIEVSETGSFVAASERLFVTQSAVSLRVQRLEELLGHPLFLRSKSGVEITPSGREFVTYAKSLLRTWEQARQQLALPVGFTKSLTIGAQSSLWPGLGFRLIDKLRAEMPDLGLRVELGLPNTFTRAMTEGVMQMALTYQPTFSPGLSIEKVIEDELVLVAPRATMDPAIAGWDDRHRSARRLDFSDRYGFAPDMTESASRVWLIHDPLNPPDAMHAALFTRPWTTPLLARRTGEGTEDTLQEMQVLDRILEAAMERKFSADYFSWLWRGRRSNASYLRATLSAARVSGHPRREAMICRSVTARLDAPRFARRLAELTGGD